MFLQAMRHEKPTNVWLGNPSCDIYTMRNNCTCSPLEVAFEDAFARGLGAGLGSDNFKFLGMKLPCVCFGKVQLPIKDMGHSPHTLAALAQISSLGVKRRLHDELVQERGI